MITPRNLAARALLTLAGVCLGASLAWGARDLVGAPAPDFTMGTIDGPNVRLSEHAGRVVMLNFWATWCGPCRQEMPALQTIYTRYEEAGFSLLGINMDAEPDAARRMAASLGVSFPLLVGDAKTVAQLYDVRAMPVTVLIDRDGQVRYVHQGYKPGYEVDYLDQVRQLLRED